MTKSDYKNQSKSVIIANRATKIVKIYNSAKYNILYSADVGVFAHDSAE